MIYKSAMHLYINFIQPLNTLYDNTLNVKVSVMESKIPIIRYLLIQQLGEQTSYPLDTNFSN